MKGPRKIIDFQVFVGRISSDLQLRSTGLPSLFVADEAGMTRGLQAARTPDANVADGGPLYIAVANSEVVEVLRFPFSIESVVKLNQSMNTDTLRLQECKAIGSRIFDFLFRRGVRDLLRGCMAEGQTVRITIATSVPELVFLPWELMCDTLHEVVPAFLCYEPKIHLVRSLRLFNRIGFTHEKLGDEDLLRVLLVTASPLSEAPIDVLQEERLLRFITEDKALSGHVQLEVLHKASVESLRERLLTYRPHVVHLACHGGFDEQDDMGFVALHSSKPETRESVDYVTSYRFAVLVKEPGTVKFTFVNSCYGAFQSGPSSFSGIAQCLHGTGVATVVALQYAVQDTTAHAILLNFYRYLLKDGHSVEESISLVRRHLFVSGYGFRESFGLTLYQGNQTLSLSGESASDEEGMLEPREFTETAELFRKYIVEEVSEAFKKHGGAVQNLALTPDDLELTHRVFDQPDVLLGLQILQKVRAANVPAPAFLRVTLLAKRLAHAKHENAPITTGIIIKTDGDAQAYNSKYQLAAGDPLKVDLISAHPKAVVSQAMTVNGVDRAMVALIQDDGRTVRFVVQELKGPSTMSSNPGEEVDALTPIARHVSNSGCALVLPGGGEIKLLVGGTQVAQYRNGTWEYADHRKLRAQFVGLAQKEKLPEDLMVDVMHKCLEASVSRRGLSLVIQRQDMVLTHCDSGYDDVKKGKGAAVLSDRKINEFGPREYLDLIAGDNSVVITASGCTLAYHVALAPQGLTKVRPVPGTGARHLSAQKLTKETDAVAVVVSVDGPISVFVNGTRKVSWPT